MKQSDLLAFIGILISLVSFSVSAIVAYYTYFRPADPKMLVGKNLLFFPSYFPDPKGNKVFGSISFFLPITFYNWRSKGTSITQIRIAIGRKDNPKKYFDMVAANFITYVDDKAQNNDVAQPIPLPSQSTVSKFIRFDWNPFGEKFEVKAGEYELIVFAWVGNDKEKAKLTERLPFFINDSEAEIYNEALLNKTPISPIWVILDNSANSQNVWTKDNLKATYGLID